MGIVGLLLNPSLLFWFFRTICVDFGGWASGCLQVIRVSRVGVARSSPASSGLREEAAMGFAEAKPGADS